MTESIEELQAILDGAPDGATHYDPFATGFYWRYNNVEWVVYCGEAWQESAVNKLSEVFEIRSLSDIKRIVELMKELQK